MPASLLDGKAAFFIISSSCDFRGHPQGPPAYTGGHQATTAMTQHTILVLPEEHARRQCFQRADPERRSKVLACTRDSQYEA